MKEFYDQMVQIWGGSPAVKPLLFGVQLAQESQEVNIDHIDAEIDQDVGDGGDPTSGEGLSLSLGEKAATPANTASRKRRSNAPNSVLALIDNKRKHIERQLSAAQRDKMFIQESKDEKDFRRQLSQSVKESNVLFANCINAMSMHFYGCYSFIDAKIISDDVLHNAPRIWSSYGSICTSFKSISNYYSTRKLCISSTRGAASPVRPTGHNEDDEGNSNQNTLSVQLIN